MLPASDQGLQCRKASSAAAAADGFGPGLAPCPRPRLARGGGARGPRIFPPPRAGTGQGRGSPPELPPEEAAPRRTDLSHPRPPAPPQPATGFRFWVDECLWSAGPVAVEAVEAALAAAGGVRTGGPGRRGARQASAGGLPAAPHDGDGEAGGGGGGSALGSSHMGAWEVLWTKSTYAIPAARAMRPGQLVSAVIGLNCLTMKKRLALTLAAAYGQAGAWALTPPTFALPEQLEEWAGWVRRQGRGGGRELWMLKTGQDAGKGLSLLPAEAALRAAREHFARGAAAEAARREAGAAGGGRGPPPRRFSLQVAQRYITDPMLIDGRKFHLRVWLLVTSAVPLRAYLHRRGLVLFSSEPYNPAEATAASPPPHAAAAPHAVPGLGAVPPSHVTNYARNADSTVWSLAQLREHMGPLPYSALWGALCTASARAVAAARGPLEEATGWLQPAVREYGFQVVGADFLLDERQRPWLLELNSAPSMMVVHACGATRDVIRAEKYGMLRDTFGMLAGRVYGVAREGAAGGGARGRRAGGEAAAAAAEEAAAGEYEPLRPYMPA